VEIYDLLRTDKKPSVSATINTAKTTLAHQNSARITLVYHEVRFQQIIFFKFYFIEFFLFDWHECISLFLFI
jgi:hypothetical protein